MPEAKDKEQWMIEFDKEFEGTMCDGTGVDYGETQRDVKDFISNLLVAERQRVIGEVITAIDERHKQAEKEGVASNSTRERHQGFKSGLLVSKHLVEALQPNTESTK